MAKRCQSTARALLQDGAGRQAHVIRLTRPAAEDVHPQGRLEVAEPEFDQLPVPASNQG